MANLPTAYASQHFGRKTLDFYAAAGEVSGSDPRARADMLDLARSLGITVVAVLHDLALVSPFADRVAVLRHGRLVAHGTPDEALSAATVRTVFAMDCFPFTNPTTGRSLLVFDTPAK